MVRKRTRPDYLNGVPELLVLALLSHRPMYGYEIVRGLEAAGEGVFKFEEGAIYPVLHRLEAAGALSTREAVVNGRRRIVYKTTRKGNRRLGNAADSWIRVNDRVRAVLSDYAPDSV